MSKDRINTGELASLLAAELGGNPREAEDFLKAFILVMEEQLLANDVMKIKGLGTFKLQWNEPRKSVDVNTAEEIMIDGYYKISFTPEPELKELVNAPFAHLQPVLLGGPEEEDMEEEEVEAVEEEVMKEMEDPRKLEEAMKSIAEQAIEIKDILAEMNMMGGTKRGHRPAMVQEKVEDENADKVFFKVKGDAMSAKVKTAKAADSAPGIETPAPVKATRPGPVVPYGPPPGVDEDELDEEYEGDTDDEEIIQREPVFASKKLPVEPSPSKRPVAPASDERVNVRRMSEQPIRLEARDARSREDELWEAPAQPKRKKARKSYGVLMLFVGLIVGGVITYLLNTMNLIPDFSGLISRTDTTVMIPLSDTGNYDSAEALITDSLYADSVVKARSEKIETVDSLQLLFDTPREYTVFIATEEVRDGSRMTRISERHYGAKEFWVYIFEANRNLLRHPDDIAKGMVLKIPQIDPRLIDKNNPRCIEYAVQLHDKYVKK